MIETAYITIPDELPIAALKDSIVDTILNNQVVIIAGETGSGKTTQLPKLCLKANRGVHGRIGHTQPRRLAARAVSARVAEELGVALGTLVGAQVRFNDETSEQTVIKLMTDGILLAEIQHDPLLKQYDTLIIDEAHERSLNIDFILGFLKKILKKRPDLKVIITSATIDVERFSAHFDHAPVIEISGRGYPIETIYLPSEPEDDTELGSEVCQALDFIIELEKNGLGYRQGDVLVFLPGEREIRLCALAIKQRQFNHLSVLPLYARLSDQEQRKIFQKSHLRKVILSTNVAETSLTVPGIRYVIDSGLARVSRYSYRSKIQRLPIEAISKASANQRQGRCGRTGPGICIRLYDEQNFNKRPDFTEPEILRTNLAQVILHMLNLNLGSIHLFPFIDKPDARFIKDGYKLLFELGAINQAHKLTPLGKKIYSLPVDPKLARMILASVELGCLKEMLVIVSVLSIQDPRDYPEDKQAQAREAHKAFIHKESDFLTLYQLWLYFEEQRQSLSKSDLQKRCKKDFLSIKRLFEWRDIHHQLHQATRNLRLKEQHNQDIPYEAIHQALLSGLLGHMGQKQEDKSYLGARNRRFNLFPGSVLFNKPPLWVMSAQIVETSKVYARINAAIEPHWALMFASHLVRIEYQNPAWSPKSGHVMVSKKVTLYGLVLSADESVNYSRINPEYSRELFIKEALVGGLYDSNRAVVADFWHHNQQLIEEIKAEEAKSRRCDVLIDDVRHYELYDARIPQDINNRDQLEHWLKSTRQTNPKALHFCREDLMTDDATLASKSLFPDTINLHNHDFNLRYHFEPGQAQDGVHIYIPLIFLNQIQETDLEPLVPGLMAEKCQEILKKLPKVQRKVLVPIPDTVKQFISRWNEHPHDLYHQLSQFLLSYGIKIDAPDLRALPIDDYYKMYIHIIDEQQKDIAHGRTLLALKQSCQTTIQEAINTSLPTISDNKIYTDWSFGELEQEVHFLQSNIKVVAYPALVDAQEGVLIKLFNTLDDAKKEHVLGLIRLLWLSLPKEIKYLSKELFKDKASLLPLLHQGLTRSFIQKIIEKAIASTFLNQPWPKNQTEFNQLMDSYKHELIPKAMQLEQLLKLILTLKVGVDKAIDSCHQLAHLQSVIDIKEQLLLLMNDDLLSHSHERLLHYPRYLKAILHRIDKLQNNPKEAMLLTQIKPWQQLLNEGRANDRLRWLIEEYRVSLFAQSLGTAEPVSEKKLKSCLT